MTNDEQMNREGDLILIHYQDKPAMYARIEAIEPDIKKDWYRVTLLLLSIPAQPVTWILRDEYINGAYFTMGGVPMRLEKVHRVSTEGESEDSSQSNGQVDRDEPAKVIPFKKK